MMDHENWVCLNAVVAGSKTTIHHWLEVGSEHGSVDDAAAGDETSVNEKAVECDLAPSMEVPAEASTELGKPAERHSSVPADHSSVPADHSSVPVDHALASAASADGDVALVACVVVLVVACVVALVVACVAEVVGVATMVADSGNSTVAGSENSTEVATEHLCSVLLQKWMPKIQGFDGEYFGTN